MRLIDQIMGSDLELTVCDPRGKVHRLPGLGVTGAEIEACPSRYIMRPDASAQCNDLLEREASLFCPENPFLRALASSFWMEWMETCASQGGAGERIRFGILVDAAADGRSGTIRCFFGAHSRVPAESPARLYFDLDCAPRPDERAGRFRLAHGDIPHLDRLLQKSVLVLDPRWRRVYAGSTLQEQRSFIAGHATTMWIALPMMLAFGALLGDGRVLNETGSDLSRINAARQKNGKRPLLEHIEVSLKLGQVSESGIGPVLGSSGRRAPRLHYVRGHAVHRADKTFWRTAHFRGDLDQPILSRTVLVHGGAGGRAANHRQN